MSSAESALFWSSNTLQAGTADDCGLFALSEGQVGYGGLCRANIPTPQPDYVRKAVGVYTLTVTPVDDRGNTCLIVIVEFFTKYVWAMPATEFSAHTIATALFGMFDDF